MVMTDRQASGSVQDSVYTALRRSIINMNLEPGKAISEKDISLLYKVSRTPVREAFIHLSQEGLIRVIPQKGTVVSLIDLRRVEQEFFLRETLERAAVRSFAEKGRAPHYDRLRALLAQQEKALEAADYILFINHDDAFHHVFFEAVGQELAWNVLASLCGHYHRVRLLTIGLKGIARNIILQHREMIDFLFRKNVEKALEILKEHLHKLSVEEALLRREFPHYFAAEAAGDAFAFDFGGFRL